MKKMGAGQSEVSCSFWVRGRTRISAFHVLWKKFGRNGRNITQEREMYVHGDVNAKRHQRKRVEM